MVALTLIYNLRNQFMNISLKSILIKMLPPLVE